MRVLVLITLLIAAMPFAGCQKNQSLEDSQRVSLADSGQAGSVAVMTVHGMACPQCANNVDLQLLKVKGVESVKIDMGSGRVTAQLSPSNPPTRDQLAQAIEKTGFTLVKIEME
jgi:Zn2+/Cd2+-exporting ATPase